MSRTVDVLDISDFRLPGGTSASIAEEVAAQSAAGWSTGLVHLNGPLVARVSPFNPRIRELVMSQSAKLLVGPEPVRAGITLIRHPGVFQHAAEHLPPIHTGRVLMVANSTMIGTDGVVEYDPARINDLVHKHFGMAPVWAPLSPAIRRQLGAVPGLDILNHDWVNIIDATGWHSEHLPPSGDRPVIGRHSRDVPAKWPGTRAEVERVYPTDGSMVVRILGGALSAVDTLGLTGRIPSSWRVWSFGARDPRDFLRDIDIYVYYPHARWIEAFGRNVLEAMAAGVPVVLPPDFEPTFGDAAVYAEPGAARSVIERLYRDHDLWSRTAEHARKQVEERFSPHIHVERLQELGDLTTRLPGRDSTAVASPGKDSGAAQDRPRLLLISSNGTGMGHLMRLMAYARRATDFEPHVLSLSQGVGAVRELGMPFEYLPSAAGLGMNPRNWQPIFTERVGAALDRIRPSIVVFDGAWPYSGIGTLRKTHPDPVWVWSRRGMWRDDRSGEQLKRSEWFDEVVEPGDFASPADTGPTASAPAIRVPPVTLLDGEDLLSRETARRELRLPADGPLALICFSGGLLDDVTSDTAATIAACRRLGLQACVTRSVVSPYVPLPDDVHVVNRIPLATYQRAFDVAISAAGYNSFHELLRFGTPTVFIPKRNSSLDDQDRRARYAADQGWSRYATDMTESNGVEVITDLLQHGQEMIAKVSMADPGNGAVDVAKLLADIHVRQAS